MPYGRIKAGKPQVPATTWGFSLIQVKPVTRNPSGAGSSLVPPLASQSSKVRVKSDECALRDYWSPRKMESGDLIPRQQKCWGHPFSV